MDLGQGTRSWPDVWTLLRNTDASPILLLDARTPEPMTEDSPDSKEPDFDLPDEQGTGPSAEFVTSVLGHSVGGTVSTMLGLGRAVSEQGWRVVLHHVSPTDPTDYIESIDPIRPQLHPSRLPWSLAISRSMKRSLLRTDQPPSVYHVHGLWTMPGHYAAQGSRRNRRPLIWTIHNMLEPKFLAFHAWRKRAFAAAFGRTDLASATCLHALTQQELADIRCYGLTNPVAVVPNGTELPADAAPEAVDALEERFTTLRNRKWLLFLGRIHPNKGLDHLIRAWAQLAGRFDEWQLVLAGPGEPRHRQRFQQLARDLALTDRATFAGLLAGIEKDAALQHAEFFVLPSFSEGLSNAALEGLAAGTPALMTPGCSFDQAVRCGAAVLAEPDVPAWVAGLEKMMTLSDQPRREMGQHGRRLIETDYTWSQVAEKVVTLYRWMLGEAPIPPFVDG